jgi:hypothetical protein
VLKAAGKTYKRTGKPAAKKTQKRKASKKRRRSGKK